MTDDLDRRLRIRLERLAGAVPVPARRAEVTHPVVGLRLAVRPSLGAMTVGVGSLLVVAAFIVIGGPARSPGTGAESPPAVVASGSNQSSYPTPNPLAQTQPTAEEMASALRFRTTFGLRADEEWIRSVFADPAASRTFGVPLLPAESAIVIAAQTAANAITDIIASYGATVPQDWAGLYVDQKGGGAVIATFKANLAGHEQALRALLPADANFEVHAATWSNEELRGFMAQVERERDWFPTIGTSFYTVEPGNDRDFNGVRVLFKGPDRTATAAVEAHFDNPPWLRAIWYGPEEWTGPRGDLEIVTTDPAGRPVPNLGIELVSLDARVNANSDSGWEANESGRLLRKGLPAVAYRVIAYEGDAEETVVVGEARVQVAPNARTTVTVIIK